MSKTNTLDVLSNWPMAHLLSDEVLVAVTAVVPIIAYPFLPSVDRSGVRCEIFLVWPSLLGLALVMIIRMLEWGSGRPTFCIGPWLFTLLWFSTSAGLKGLLLPRGRKPKPEDFTFSATSVFGIFQYHFLGLFDDLFLPEHAEAGWLRYLLRLLTIALGILVLSGAIYACLNQLGPTALFRFVTRQVRWWYWLPENGALDDFGPGWSIALAIAVAIMPLLVLFVAIINVQGRVSGE